MAPPKRDIDTSKIPEAIQLLDAGKTKKFVCEFLGMPYNTTRLTSLIQEYLDGVKVDKEQRRKRRGKPITPTEVSNFCEAYLIDDESMKDIGTLTVFINATLVFCTESMVQGIGYSLQEIPIIQTMTIILKWLTQPISQTSIMQSWGIRQSSASIVTGKQIGRAHV